MDQKTTEVWEAVALPHNYVDGTLVRWAVRYKSQSGLSKGATVQVSDWLTKDTAHLVSAAPDLLAACQDCMENRGDWGAAMGAAIAKATGRELKD